MRPDALAVAQRWGGVVRLGPALLALLAVAAGGCTPPDGSPRPPPGAAVAHASIDRAAVDFGDDLTLTVEVRSDAAQEVSLPHAAEFEGFRLLESGTGHTQESGVEVERRWYRLRAERSGTLTVPAQTVLHRPLPLAGASDGGEPQWAEILTEPIDVEVRSLLPGGDTAPEPRDIKPLQPIDRGPPWYWIAASALAIVAAAAAVAYWVRRRRPEPAAAPAPPPVPAHVIALAELDRLAAAELPTAEALRRAYFELSEVVRAYVEGRFGLNATDLTTEEILRSLHRLPLSPADGDGLRSFLGDTDWVKFAGGAAEREQWVCLLQWSRGFVESTRPQPQPGQGSAGDPPPAPPRRETA